MKGGDLRTNPGVGNPDIVEPACEIDRELSVVYMLENGKPTGAIINFALHPAIVCGTKSHGDYISVVAEEMKKKFGDGFITLFINGACGNINHINPFDERTVQPGIHNVIGKKIAETAMHAHGLEPEQICFSWSGQLKQRNTITRLIRSETRACLSVKTYYLLRTQISDRPVEFCTDAVYYLNLTRKRCIFKLLQIFPSYTFNIHNTI
jgi:hypothetical protein